MNNDTKSPAVTLVPTSAERVFKLSAKGQMFTLRTRLERAEKIATALSNCLPHLENLDEWERSSVMRYLEAIFE